MPWRPTINCRYKNRRKWGRSSVSIGGARTNVRSCGNTTSAPPGASTCRWAVSAERKHPYESLWMDRQAGLCSTRSACSGASLGQRACASIELTRDLSSANSPPRHRDVPAAHRLPGTLPQDQRIIPGPELLKGSSRAASNATTRPRPVRRPTQRLPDDFALRREDIPRRPDLEPPCRALPPEILAQLCDALPLLRTRPESAGQ